MSYGMLEKVLPRTLPRTLDEKSGRCVTDSLVLMFFTLRRCPSLSFTLRLQIRHAVVSVDIQRRVARQRHYNSIGSPQQCGQQELSRESPLDLIAHAVSWRGCVESA